MGDMTRMDIAALAPAAYRALTALDSRAHQGDLPAGLLDLVKLRVSQVNGCAYCVDSHSHDLVKGGETPARVYAVAAWDEGPFFSPAERAAFALAESMTRLSEGAPRVPDDVWEQARAHYDDAQLAQLIMVITTINAWNRVSVAVRLVPESFA